MLEYLYLRGSLFISGSFTSIEKADMTRTDGYIGILTDILPEPADIS